MRVYEGRYCLLKQIEDEHRLCIYDAVLLKSVKILEMHTEAGITGAYFIDQRIVVVLDDGTIQFFFWGISLIGNDYFSFSHLQNPIISLFLSLFQSSLQPDLLLLLYFSFLMILTLLLIYHLHLILLEYESIAQKVFLYRMFHCSSQSRSSILGSERVSWAIG